jgi:hypothetical protein
MLAKPERCNGSSAIRAIKSSSIAGETNAAAYRIPSEAGDWSAKGGKLLLGQSGDGSSLP